MRMLTLAARLRLTAFFTSLVIGTLGLQLEAAAAATGQPVAYVLTSNNTITVIDTGNQQVLRTIQLPSHGGYIVGAPDGKHVFVTGSDPTTPNPDGLPGVVWVIDTQTSTIVARPWFDLFATGLAISGDGSRVYVVSNADNIGSQVKVIDTASNAAIATINDSVEGSVGITVSPNGARVYVPLLGGHTERGGLDVINAATDLVSAGPSPTDSNGTNQFFWAAVSPDNTKIYASVRYEDQGGTPLGGTFIFNASTNQQLAAKNLGGTLSTPSPTANILYGTTSTGGVVVFNTQTDTVTKTIPVASTINSLAVTPDGKKVYVSNSNTQSIAIIDATTNTVTGSVPVAGATGLTIVAAPPPVVSTPPVVSLQISPTAVPPDSPASVSWTASGATSCTSSGAWSGAVPLQGVSQISFSTPGSYTVTLTCTGPGGTTSASAKLTVIAGSTLTTNATDIPLGGKITASWKAFAGATHCELAIGQGGNDVPVTGSQTSGPLQQAGSYVLSLYCDGAPGFQTVEKTFTVYVPGAPGFASLVLADNLNAIGTPGTPPANGGIDGRGYAVDGQALLALPAHTLTAYGQPLAFGPASKPSALWGQPIALGSAPLTAVTFVATAINGDQLNQKFVVTYSDGSTTTYTQSLADWGSGNQYAGQDGYDPATLIATEESITLGTRLTPAGAKQGPFWFLHKFRIPLDGTKIATSLQLPKNRDVIVFAVNVTKASSATAESLAPAFNVTALATAGQASSGPRLASGYAFDASLVPNGFTGVGQQFTIGAANQPDSVSNANITLPAKPRQGLTVLATGLNGNQPNQSFKVTYQDGSTTVFTQSVSDWHQPQNYAGESIARNTAFRITPTGTRQAGVWDLYAYTFPTDPGKKVVSLTLPSNRNVVVLAVNSLTQ